MGHDTGEDRCDPSAVAALLGDALGDPHTTWSLGSFGAGAAFLRAPEEAALPIVDGRPGWATARGAIVLSPSTMLRPVAYETGFSSGWSHAVALCLPRAACAGNRRTVVTELGPDRDAARYEDRHGILFDLGLGMLAVDACLRATDSAILALLRGGSGRSVFDPGSPVGPDLLERGPTAVFLTRIGRIEVVPPRSVAGGTGAVGPRTYILPRLLRGGRTHAATAPIPVGWVPCGALHPPHPCKDLSGHRIPFRRDRYAAFQALLARWGDPALLAAKCDPMATGRHARSARRAGEAQDACLRGDDVR